MNFFSHLKRIWINENDRTLCGESERLPLNMKY